MCKKIFAAFFLLVALGLGIVVSAWPHKLMHEIVFITRFFEVMIPVLAVGALIKYLCCCKTDPCDKKEQTGN